MTNSAVEGRQTRATASRRDAPGEVTLAHPGGVAPDGYTGAMSEVQGEGTYPDVPEVVAHLPHLTALITLHAPGLPDYYMPSGARVPAWFDRERTSEGWPIVHDVAVYFEGGVKLLPGESGRALVYPFSPAHWPALQEGSTFEIWVGKPIAVVEVLTPLVG